MKVRSFYPPTSYYSTQENQWYLVCSSDGDGWVKVSRSYEWREISSIWDRIVYELKEAKKKVTKKLTYFVEGSRGNKYEVVNGGGTWSCSCPSFGFGRGKSCKHIIQIQNKK